MKKIITAITAAAICLSAAGCSGGLTGAPPDPKITGSFGAGCTVTAFIIPPGGDADDEAEFTFSGQTRRLGGGFWEMTVDSPETVAGLEISLEGDTLSSRMNDLTFDIGASQMPDSSPLKALFSELDEAAARLDAQSVLSPGEEGGWVYSGSNCSIVFDGNGYPVSMAVTEPKMTVQFTSFTVSSGNTDSIVSETTAPETSVSETMPVPETTASETRALETSITETASETASITSAAETTLVSESTVSESVTVSSAEETSLTEVTEQISSVSESVSSVTS